MSYQWEASENEREKHRCLPSPRRVQEVTEVDGSGWGPLNTSFALRSRHQGQDWNFSEMCTCDGHYLNGVIVMVFWGNLCPNHGIRFPWGTFPASSPPGNSQDI